MSGTPPIRNDGIAARRRASTCASSDEVVVLPCVPATTSERVPGQEQLREQRRERVERNAARAGGQHLDVVLAADVADHDARRAPTSRFSGRNPSNTGIPSSASCVDMGG